MKKVIAIYLPQFHEIKENNEWWGKGYTEWTNVKTARSLFKEHYQPRIPLNHDYYDLSDVKNQIKQAEIAQKYGIYGFCYYHYWFEGHMIMEKPAEQILLTKEITLPFCFSWANHTWYNSPSRKSRHLLIEQTYGNESDWTDHFNYLKSFFRDERYIKVKGKPLMIIYDATNIGCWPEMKKLWDSLAKKEGWDGLYYVNTLKHDIDEYYSKYYGFDAQFEYQPTYALAKSKRWDYAKFYNLKRILCKDFLDMPCECSYSRIWNRVLNKQPKNGILTYLGAYNDWDTTARWKTKGIVHKGSSPDVFQSFFKKLVNKSDLIADSDFIFITAWNEWSEGAYLEADEKWKYGYLEAIKEVLENR